MDITQNVQLLVISLIIGTIINAFFCLTLYKTLKLIKPENRQLQPFMIWLLLIPLVNLFINFIVVIRMAASITNELVSRDYEVDENPGFAVGIAYAVLAVVANIPMPFSILGVIGIVGLILFIQYWMKINWYRKVLLEETPAEEEDDEG